MMKSYGVSAAVFSSCRKVHANLQPRLSHHVDGALERLSAMARTDATGLPSRQLAGPRRTSGTLRLCILGHHGAIEIGFIIIIIIIIIIISFFGPPAQSL